jgi:hypothetical protein
MNSMTYDEAEDLYISQIDLPHGSMFAASVGRFQEGFLADRVTDDLDEAFRRGVECAAKFIEIFKAKT